MKNGVNMVTLWFSVVMVLVVIAGAIAFTFTDFMIDRVYGSKRIILTVVFLGYAVFRGVRIYQIFQSNRNND